jgi:hypothetical protein
MTKRQEKRLVTYKCASSDYRLTMAIKLRLSNVRLPIEISTKCQLHLDRRPADCSTKGSDFKKWLKHLQLILYGHFHGPRK